MKKILTLTFLLFSITYSFGQYDWTKGELKLKSGEIIKGYIKLPVISKNLIALNGKSKIKFRKSKKSKKIKFDETQIDLITFQHSDTEIAYYKYISTSQKKREIFKVVVNGKASLYSRAVNMTNLNGSSMMMGTNYTSYPHTTISNSDEYYVQRKGETIASPLITMRISKSFRHRATEYFNDCPLLVSKLKNKILTEIDIIEVVKEYNSLN